MKQKIQVLLYNRKMEIIRKITVNRDSIIDKAWMNAIDPEVTFYAKDGFELKR